MNVALKEAVTPEVLGNLFKYYISSKLSSKSSYDAYISSAKAYLDQNNSRGEIKDKGSIMSLENGFIEDILEFGGDVSVIEKYDFILGLENFIAAVQNVIEEYEPKFLNYKGLKRQVPSLEMFEYVGFNELNIMPSKTSYSLLFE